MCIFYNCCHNNIDETTGRQKEVHPVKIQSYADDTTIIINQYNEIKYIYEIFNKHSRASEAAINMGKKNKYSDLVIDMFRQNQSMTNSPERLKTRHLGGSLLYGQTSRDV